MKTERKNLTTILLMSGMLLSVSKASAGVGELFDKYIASEFNNLTGLYIVLGVILVGVIGKLFQNYLLKEEKAVKAQRNLPSSRYKYHRHRAVVKKTS